MNEKKRIAIITGTSSGIGEGVARALVAGGWTVLGLARRPAKIEAPHYSHLIADLADLVALETVIIPEIIQVIKRKDWDRVALINNAAAMGSLQSVSRFQTASLAQTFAVNAISPTMLMSVMSREVPTTTSLRIVNVSTGAVHDGIPGLGDYSASKAALRLSGMALASEFDQTQRPDAAILSYEPGIVDTEMQRKARTGPANFPSRDKFQEFHTSGLLQPVEAVIGEMFNFLNGRTTEPFLEKRFGQT